MSNFDVQGARNAGFSNDEIVNSLAKKRGYDLTGARNAGFNDDDIINLLAAPRPVQQSASNDLQYTGTDEDRDGALSYSVDQAQQLWGRGVQSIGELFGSEGAENIGRNIVEQQKIDIASGGYQSQYNRGSLRETFNEDGFGNAAGYVLEKMLENSATSGAALVGAGAAGIAAVFSAPAALVIGGGTYISSALMGTGEAAQEMEDKGVDVNNAKALGAGVLIGILDKFGAGKVFPAGTLLNSTGDQVVKELVVKGYGEAAKEVAKKLTKKVGAETVTEVGQESIPIAVAASEGATYTNDEILDTFIDTAFISMGMSAGPSAVSTAVEVNQGLKNGAKVPPTWSKRNNDDGSVSVVNDLTGEDESTHRTEELADIDLASKVSSHEIDSQLDDALSDDIFSTDFVSNLEQVIEENRTIPQAKLGTDGVIYSGSDAPIGNTGNANTGLDGQTVWSTPQVPQEVVAAPVAEVVPETLTLGYDGQPSNVFPNRPIYLGGPVREVGNANNGLDQTVPWTTPVDQTTSTRPTNEQRGQAALNAVNDNDLNQYEPSIEDTTGPTTRYQPNPDHVEVVKAQGLDERFADDNYRNVTNGMLGDLVKGGGIVYTYDSNDRITGRTSSGNPDWFKDSDSMNSMKYVEDTVAKALSGKKLGVNQQAVITEMMNYHDEGNDLNRNQEYFKDSGYTYEEVMQEPNILDYADERGVELYQDINDSSVVVSAKDMVKLAVEAGVDAGTVSKMYITTPNDKAFINKVNQAIWSKRNEHREAKTPNLERVVGGREGITEEAGTQGEVPSGAQAGVNESLGQSNQRSESTGLDSSFDLTTQTESELATLAGRDIEGGDTKAQIDREAPLLTLDGGNATLSSQSDPMQNDQSGDLFNQVGESVAPTNKVQSTTEVSDNLPTANPRFTARDDGSVRINPKNGAPEHSNVEPRELDESRIFTSLYEDVERLEMSAEDFKDVVSSRSSLFKSPEAVYDARKSVDPSDIVYAPEPIKTGEDWVIPAGSELIKERQRTLDDYEQPDGGERITISKVGERFVITSNYNNRYTHEPKTFWVETSDAPVLSRQDSANNLEDAIIYAKGMWLNIYGDIMGTDKWNDSAIEQTETALLKAENGGKTILSLFDYTGHWGQPYADAGYNVIPLDIQNGHDITKLSNEYLSEELGIEGEIWGILAACPCTDFASSGARHFKAKDADGRTEASKDLVIATLDLIETLDPVMWVLENPMGRIQRLTGLPKARMKFDPWVYGDAYTKETYLFGKFNTDLPQIPVDPVMKSIMHKKYGGKSLKTKNARSATPKGFAAAFFQANNEANQTVQQYVDGRFPELSKSVEAAIGRGAVEEDIREAIGDDPFESSDTAQVDIENLSVDGSTDTETAPADTAPTEALTKKGTALVDKASERFEDFGEVIYGAKKDTATIREALSADIDVSAVPLSKSFPKPNYVKLAEAGVDRRILGLISFLRGNIPAKPRKSHKIRRWAESVEKVRNIASGVMSGELAIDHVVNTLGGGVGDKLNGLRPLLSIANYIPADAIQEIGNFKLTKMFFSKFGDKNNVNKWEVKDSSQQSGLGGMGASAYFDTIEEAVNHLKEQISNPDSTASNQLTKFDVWSTRGEEGFVLGKKIGTRKYIELGNFDTAQEALNYSRDNNALLVEQLKQKKKIGNVRRSEQNERVGIDRRKGKNITSAEFGDTFGFRGVQFGNYVENDKRQQDINNAYDGLLDLAEIIGVPPKAISLNGELGLAFGARGSGGQDSAAAHYESGNVVINLTKINGAGSLAHEWWHALDDYFGRMGAMNGYITEKERKERGIIKNEAGESTYGKLDPKDFGVRPEVYDAFKNVVSVLEQDTTMTERAKVLDGRKSKDYWSTVIEVTARTFETYIIKKLQNSGYESDYLATILPKDAWDAMEQVTGNFDESYPYPTESELAAVEPALDALFDVMESKETDSGVALFSRTDTDKAGKLDMSNAARMERAKEMGFNIDEIVYHGTKEDFDAFDPERAIGTQYWSTTDKASIEAGEAGAQGSGVIKAMYVRIKNPADWDLYDRLGIDELIGRGYDGVALKEGDHTTYIAFDPNQYRSIDAAFDPAQADSSNTFFSRSPSISSKAAAVTEADSRATVSAHEASEVIDSIIVDWAGDNRGDEFVLVDTYEDLPQKIKDDAKDQDAENSIKGVFHNNKTYIVLDELSTKADVERVILHEHLGHYGIRKVFGKGVNIKLNQVYMAAGGRKGIEALAAKHNINLDDYFDGLEGSSLPEDVRNRIIVEELIAHMQEDSRPALQRKIKELMGELRSWLRDKGFMTLAKFNDSDLHLLMKRSRDSIVENAGVGGDGTVAFSRNKETLAKVGLGITPTKKLTEAMKKILKSPFSEGFGERLYEGVFDGSHGIKKAEDEVGKGIAANDYANSGHVGVRLAKGVADVMHGILNYGAPEWKDGVVQRRANTQGALEIFSDLGKDLDNWLGWIAGNRGDELMSQDRENNLNAEDITYLKGLNKGKEAQFEAARQEYMKINKAMLDLAEEAGTLDADSRVDWESEWYIPFYRSTDDHLRMGPKTSGGISHQTSGIKKLVGGDMATSDLLENIITNWLKLADSSLKNSALLKTVDNLKGSRFLTEETMKYKQVNVSRSQINSRIRSDRKYVKMVADMLGIPNSSEEAVLKEMTKLDSKGFEKLWQIVAPSDPDVIRVMREGKNEYYKVNDEGLLRGITHFQADYMGGAFMKTGRWFKRLVTTGVTSSPDFILRNFVRDAVHAHAINQDNMTFGLDSMRGVYNAATSSEEYRSLSFGGASFQGGYIHGADPEETAQIIRRDLKARGLNQDAIETHLDSVLSGGKKTSQAIQRGWQAYRTIGDKLENSNRLATFEAALKSGKPMAQALYEAKDLMDYSLRGNFQAMIVMTDMVPFLNARLQGLSKLARAAKDDPNGWKLYRNVVVQSGIKIAAFSMALAAFNDDEERYQQLEDWDKDAYWHFFIGDEHLRLPKPFEIGVLFGTIPERIWHTQVAQTQGNDKLMWSIKHNLLETLALNPTPQFLKPTLEGYMNRDMWRDRPIEGASDLNRRPQDRYSSYTSDVMKKLGEWTGTSPKKLEHIFKGHTGTMGAYMLSSVDYFSRWGMDTPDRPEMRMNEYPVIKSFWKGDGPARSVQGMTDLYDRMGEVGEIYSSIKFLAQQGKLEEARKLAEENRGSLRYRTMLNKASRSLSDMRKQQQAIYNSRVMSPSTKRDRLDDIQIRMNKLAKRVSEATEGAF